ncbi:hypothetical protein FZ990_12275 [Clostridium perfringens]|nr:hypothetical protein [Clostridium perfringens]
MVHLCKDQLEVFDNVENLGFYLGKMTTDLDPLFFIGDKPIYQFEGWSNEGHVFIEMEMEIYLLYMSV